MFYIENKKIMGRPVIKSRNKSLHLRISEDEYDLISKCSEKSGLPRTDVIINGVKMLMETLK